MTTARMLLRRWLHRSTVALLGLAAGLLFGGFLTRSAMTVDDMQGDPTVPAVWRAHGCQSTDLGDYDGVIVGGDTVGEAWYVRTGRRLADDDPRWRRWGNLWATCKERSRPAR